MALAETEYGRFHYFLNDEIGGRIAAGEFFDSHLRPFMDALKPGQVLADIGANIGFFTVYCAKRGASVYAFEASSECYELLLSNIGLNGLTTVKAYNIALYDSFCRLGFNPAWIAGLPRGQIRYDQMSNSGGLSLIPDADGIFSARTLDSFGLPRVDLLKVDTQGADLRVLIGARETIKKFHPIICFEYEDGGSGRNASGDSFGDFLAYLDSLGYEARKLVDHEFGSDWIASIKES